MTFSDGDKALIKESAYEVGRLLLAEFEDHVNDKIEKHGFTCDAREAIAEFRATVKAVKGTIRGIILLCTLLGSATGGLGTFAALRWFGQTEIKVSKDKESEVKNEKSSFTIDHRLGRLRGGSGAGR